MNSNTVNKVFTVHHGKNIRRIREISGVKQESLAKDLGMSQQSISQLEQKELIDEKLLIDIANALKVTTDAIKNMTDDAAMNFINTFNDNSGFNYQCTFNPLDKLIETVETNKKLYERLLETEKEKCSLLEKLLYAKSN
jgi:transcriptional regulator with XRE-family HTH domain